MTASAPAPSTLVRPFTIAIPDSEIEDLKLRLARTRWPDPETVPDWSQGVRLENTKSLIDYWEREYDWRRFESELNRFPHFLTTIDGLDIHFIHVKSKNPNAMPLIFAFPAQIPDTLSPEERYAVDTLALYTGDMGGANHLQGTKPETIGIALADSPAGQAAWIYDKFQSKTDNRGLAEDALTTDEILDAISLYWFTNSTASSARIYWENKGGSMAGPTMTLPVAVTVFPADIPRLPRSWIEDTYTDLIHYGEAVKGGHFAAFEQPEILISEIRTGLSLNPQID